jgi:hypothetical protein
MADALTHPLKWYIGGASVEENLAGAVTDGRLKPHEDGTFEIVERPTDGPDPWLRGSKGLSVSCSAQVGFLFRVAYAKSAVPSGCRACYKVKIIPRTLRQLVAVYGIAQTTAYVYKCGLDGVPSSQCIYSAFFYAHELSGARAMYATLRKAVDEHPNLGSEVKMLIKRGCTEYEMSCGPSDKYTFDPNLPEVESWLLAHLRRRSGRRSATALDVVQTRMLWIQTAYKHGDETYRDFTNGRPLHPATVCYDPNDPAEPGDGRD